jgi:hypothetical protein
MTKLVFPKWRDDFQVFRDSFDKDNPIPPFKRPRKASTNSTKTSVTLRAARLAAFGMINLSTAPTFILTSESKLYSRIRRYQGMQGMLDSTTVPEPDLAMLRHVIHLSGQDTGEAVVAQDKTFTAIADSGCSITCTNNKADFIPGTIEDLPNPIKLGRIAGGLTVTQCGQVSWELPSCVSKILLCHMYSNRDS